MKSLETIKKKKLQVDFIKDIISHERDRSGAIKGICLAIYLIHLLPRLIYTGASVEEKSTFSFLIKDI